MIVREGTELLIGAMSARTWYVVERPTPVGDAPIPQSEIKQLYSARSEELALAWAEGRQSVTGQPIRE